MMKLLIIEDNPRLSLRIKQQLQKWFTIELASTGHEGLELTASHSFDIILLDLGLPDTPGLEVCKQLRKISSSTPILVVTGIDTIDSRVSLLDAGADDYVTKPFNVEELVARINALGRRSARSESIPVITIGNLVIDPARRKVSRDNSQISLRRKEFDILHYLAINAGRVMSREMIIHNVWPITSSSWTGSVDVHIKQLRDKIDKPFSYPLIRTSYGVGYIIDVPEESNVA